MSHLFGGVVVFCDQSLLPWIVIYVLSRTSNVFKSSLRISSFQATQFILSPDSYPAIRAELPFEGFCVIMVTGHRLQRVTVVFFSDYVVFILLKE